MGSSSAQGAILFDQIRERLPLSALEPASQDPQQHLESGGGEHEREVISQQALFAVHNRRPSCGTVRD
jgi:hypothetical protein